MSVINCRNVFTVASLALLSACSTIKETRYIERVNPENCDIIATEQSFTNGKPDAPPASYKSPDQVYADRCGGEREEAQEKQFATEQYEYRKSIAFKAMAVRVGVKFDNPDRESEVEKRFLALVDSEFPEVREEAQALLTKYEINEHALRGRVAQAFINSQVDAVRKDDGGPNLPVVAMLIDLYREDKLPAEKRRFPKVSGDVLRTEIDAELGQEGLSIEALEKALMSSFGRKCEDKVQADGSVRTGCETVAAPGLFIMD